MNEEGPFSPEPKKAADQRLKFSEVLNDLSEYTEMSFMTPQERQNNLEKTKLVVELIKKCLTLNDALSDLEKEVFHNMPEDDIAWKLHEDVEEVLVRMPAEDLSPATSTAEIEIAIQFFSRLADDTLTMLGRMQKYQRENPKRQ